MAHEHMMLRSMIRRRAQPLCSYSFHASPPRVRAAARDRAGPTAGRQRGAQLTLRDAAEPRDRLRA